MEQHREGFALCSSVHTSTTRGKVGQNLECKRHPSVRGQGLLPPRTSEEQWVLNNSVFQQGTSPCKGLPGAAWEDNAISAGEVPWHVRGLQNNPSHCLGEHCS